MLELKIYPDPFLREICKPVSQFDSSLHSLLDEMKTMMYQENGIGLAANQVGHLKRLFIADVSCMFTEEYIKDYGPAEEWDKKLIEFINPVIIHKDGVMVWSEGCLSLPTIYYDVERASSITIQAQDRNGVAFECRAKNILAVCCQHEVDHLDGNVFIDYVSTSKKQTALSKLKKMKKTSGTRGG